MGRDDEVEREQQPDPGARGSRQVRALEINDAIVQGLTVIKYALELGDLELAERTADETLAAARRVITSLLTEQWEGGEPTADAVRLVPGALVRRDAGTLTPSQPGGAA